MKCLLSCWDPHKGPEMTVRFEWMITQLTQQEFTWHELGSDIDIYGWATSLEVLEQCEGYKDWKGW